MNNALRSSLLGLALLGCSGESGDDVGAQRASAASPTGRSYATEIELPQVLRGLPLLHDDAGNVTATTPCATCHDERNARALPLSAERLGGPHAGLRVRHGELRCAACHDEQRRDRLHLADGRSVPLVDAMELCAQCHGPQKRDYEHGAHGGVRGHWDLARGPRTRNHCVACHDPHAPSFGKFMPVAAPRDRFSSPPMKDAQKHD